jgi:hypothetical protein
VVQAIHQEEIAGDRDPHVAAGVVIAQQNREIREGCQLPQSPIIVAQVQVFAIGDLPRLTLQARFGDHADETSRVLVNVRAEHQPVGHGEDAGIDTDAHREGENHHRREEWRAGNHAAAITNVGQESGQKQGWVAAVFGDLLFPGLRQDAARGHQAGGEHFGRALRGGAVSLRAYLSSDSRERLSSRSRAKPPAPQVPP